MGKLYRYQFTKEIYPNHIVFLVVKGKIVTYHLDLNLLNYLIKNYGNDDKNIDYLKLLKKKHINYLILDDLDITDKVEYKDNRYDKYMLVFTLNKIVNKIKKQKEKNLL